MIYLFKKEKVVLDELSAWVPAVVELPSLYIEEKKEPPKPQERTTLCGQFEEPIEIITEIQKDPLGEYFIVDGTPKPVKVSMPVFIDGQPITQK